MSRIVFLKLSGLFPIAYNAPETLIGKHQSYMKQITDDARACGYHFSLKEWMLLHSSSKILLRLTGFAELVSRSLKYRLKSK